VVVASLPSPLLWTAAIRASEMTVCPRNPPAKVTARPRGALLLSYRGGCAALAQRLSQQCDRTLRHGHSPSHAYVERMNPSARHVPRNRQPPKAEPRCTMQSLPPCVETNSTSFKPLKSQDKKAQCDDNEVTIGSLRRAAGSGDKKGVSSRPKIAGRIWKVASLIRSGFAAPALWRT
jgi:hypothetical protein